MQKIMDKEYIQSRLNLLMQSPEERLNKKNNLTEFNKEKLLSLKNIHKGKRCFVIGSSPSIKELDLTKLNNEITFTVNRGYKLKEQGLNKSTYHVMSDVNTLNDENVRSEIPSNFAEQFLIYAGINFPIKEKVTYFDYIHNSNKLDQSLTQDITDPFISCSTVIAYTLQFAFFMGFNEINIIGVDLDFYNISGHSYKETDGEKNRQLNASFKHEKIMLDGITNISQQLINKGLRVQNASPLGALNSIPRVNYNKIVES